MSNINTNLPGFNFTGVNDQSTALPVLPPLVEPQHFPFFFLRTQMGSDKTIMIVLDENDAIRQLGSETFNPRGIYWNHQTLALQTALQNGNACAVKRITTTGVGNVPLTNAAAVVMATVQYNTTIYEFARDTFGNVIYDINTNLPTFKLVNGQKVAVPGGVLVTLSVVPLGEMSVSHLTAPLASTGVETWVDNNGAPITWSNGNNPVTWSAEVGVLTYPLFLIPAMFPGIYGNSFGFKMWAATPGNPYPGNQNVVNDQSALIFNAQIIQNVGSSTPNTVSTLLGDDIVQFMFKPNAYNKYTNQDLTIQALNTAWTDNGFKNKTSPAYGPFGAITVFENNLEALLNILYTAELANNPNPPGSKWLLDFLSGSSADGTAAYGFQIDSSGDILSSGNSFYLSGGKDGSLLNSDYEAAIRNFTQYGYDTEECPATNILKYPFSDIYDTGFGIDTKETLPMWMGLRPNTSVHLASYTDGSPPLMLAEEISLSAVLSQQLLNQAESNVYGTPAFRATLTLQSGFLNNGYDKRVSLIFENLVKRCIYMGAGNGIMSINGANDYTLYPNNQIQYFESVSVPNFNKNSSKEAWNNGAIFTVPSGMNEQYFYPYIHTIYPNDTSILTSDVIRHICGRVALLQAKVWVQLVGRDDLAAAGDATFISESDKLFNKLANNVFANKAILTPTTYMTAADSANGFSWTQVVRVQANVAKTVATFIVVTQRLSNTTTTG